MGQPDLMGNIASPEHEHHFVRVRRQQHQSFGLPYPGQAAGEVIRSLAWVGPAGSAAALGQIRRRLPASELQAVANARARLPTWLASQVSALVTRA